MTTYFIAAAVTLVLVDMLLATEVLSVAAYGLIATVIVQHTPVSDIYMVATWFAIFCTLLVLHFQVLRGITANIVNRYVTPTKVLSGDDAIVRQQGTVCNVSGRRFVRVADQLCEFHDDGVLRDGDLVIVNGSEGGRLIVSRKEE